MGGSGRTFSLTEEASADVTSMLPASNAEEMETAMAGAALLPMRVEGEARSAATASERSSSVVLECDQLSAPESFQADN